MNILPLGTTASAAQAWQPSSVRQRTSDAAADAVAIPGFVPSTPKGTALRQAALSTADLIRAAFANFTSSVRPIFDTVVSRTSAIAASVKGLVPRVSDGTHGILRTLEPINTQTSTVRASGRLNLNLSPAASRLSSGDLALDVTSPAAASFLASAAALGLDLTSPDAPSVVRSAAALGIDLTSPETVSRLASAVLGLDLTSPDAASVLRSWAALGLDITSPDLVSTNRSSAALGLDVTSPEAASLLKSSAGLGLDVTSPQSSSTLVSTAPVNSASTTYAPSVSFSSGTAVATLTGSYTGVGSAASTTSLTIKMRSNATIGSTAATVHFQVLDGGTTLVDYSGSIKAGDKIYLGDDIGLFVSFSAGTAANNATGTSAVSHSTPTVDATATFNNANVNLRPRLDNGVQITAGAFTVNGVAIAVNAGDSINAVIARINASAAGVTASFANNRLTLTSTSPSEDNIFVANDTSGFLSAMKLAAPNAEINGATTSYGSRTLAFDNGSSVATLSGTYTGVGDFAGATSLTVKITSGLVSLNTSSATNLRFSVVDQGNHTLFTFNGSVKAGDKIAIGNETGLWVSFSAGNLFFNDTGSTTVSNTVKTDVDAAATFNNADVNLRPRFENEAQVTAGSFTVNGTVVAVNANDSINAVLARINSTVSGVTASFANDRITIVNSSGSNPVVLANDTSGFLAATKLAAAVTAKGNVRDDQQVLSKTTQFAAVASGSFSINGASISVSKDTDTLSTIISRINASAAGVTASYDAAQDKVLLTTNVKSEDLITVSGDTSGFVTAAKLSTANTARGNIRDDQQVLAKTTQFGGVATGSFTINGVSIGVNKDTDTLSSILSRINASAAGVVASYDVVTDKVVFATTSRSEDLITLGGDTTGFLTAAKLATGNTVRGNIRDDQQVLAKTTQFGAVATGAVTINGVAIAVNKDVDTLATILDRITSSAAGVTATFDGTANAIVLTGKTDSEDLIAVGGDTAGFLTAGKLQTSNTTRGHIREDIVALRNLSRFSSVVDGSFVVDGKTIDVTTDDTIQSIVSKIDGSGARVTASFDAAANKLLLATGYNTEDAVPVGNDTSGFLAAAGVSAANTVAGNIRDDSQVLAKTSQFGSVTTGSFTVNGVTISVDKDVDTLSTVLDRITSSAAGVTATFDAAQDKIVLTGKTNSQSVIAVGDDSSGFLAAGRLQTSNTERGHLDEEGVALADLSSFGPVSNGSFVIDGRTIAIDVAHDTIDSVVDKINISGARVVASYDRLTDRLRLDATYNSEDDLPIGSDTTGFLAAARLDPAGTVKGNIRDDEQVLSKTSQFGAVTDGVFRINGRTIAVNATLDSVSSLVDKINAAGAGVTAAFDAATNRIGLVGDGPSEDAIVVDGDTSGFTAVAGLSTANTVRGNISDLQQPLSAVPRFSTVAAGSFAVNGVSIHVDPAADTLADVLDRVTMSSAGVIASYDSVGDRIVFTPRTVGAPLSLDNDTTGLFAAAGVAAGTVGTHVRADAAFDATGIDGPLFDPGRSVHAGTFTVNGAVVDVAAGDSINSVLAKISRSAADVNATYDDATQTVRLTARSGVAPVVVADDTSGFVSAVKLDTGEAASGTSAPPPYDSALRNVSGYESVVAGTLTINGTTFNVDPTATTLRGLLAAVNAAGGVRATLDERSGALTVTSTTGGSLAVSDTSGVLAAAGIAAGTYRSVDASETSRQVQSGTEVVSNAADVAAGVRRAIDAMNETIAQLGIGITDRDLLSQLADVANRSIATLGGASSGISVAQSDAAPMLSVDEKTLADGLTATTKSSLSDAVAAAIESLGNDAASAIDQDAASRAAAAAVRPFVVWPRPTRTIADAPSIDTLALNNLLPTMRHATSTIASTAPTSPSWKSSEDSPFRSLFDVFSDESTRSEIR